MTKEMKLRVERSTVTPALAYSHVTAILKRERQIEMDAKNRAYHFIITHGLMQEFLDFCKAQHSSDPHSDCLRTLSVNL